MTTNLYTILHDAFINKFGDAEFVELDKHVAIGSRSDLGQPIIKQVRYNKESKQIEFYVDWWSYGWRAVGDEYQYGKCVTTNMAKNVLANVLKVADKVDIYDNIPKTSGIKKDMLDAYIDKCICAGCKLDYSEFVLDNIKQSI